MKNLNFTTIVFCCLLYTAQTQAQTNIFPESGSAGIGTTSPDNSAILDMVSTTKGALVPRMSQSERDAILSPAEGLLIYQNDGDQGFYFHNGDEWNKINAGSGSYANTSLSNLSPTSINESLNPLTSSTYNLGSVTNAWNRIYLDGAYYLDGGAFMHNNGGYTATFVGNSSGLYNTGVNNTGIGAFNMLSNTSGSNNTGLGYTTLYSNSSGSNNTATGSNALYSNSSGSNNTANGAYTLNKNSSGSYNSATGNNALKENTTGMYNTADGANALQYNKTGSGNAAFGKSALYKNINGTSNTAIGAYSLFQNTAGSDCTAIGFASQYSNSNKSYNTSIGAYSLYDDMYADYNTAIGYGAMQYTDGAYLNVAIGSNALNRIGYPFNYIYGSVAIGSNALGHTDACVRSIAIGYGAADSAYYMTNSIAIGTVAMAAEGEKYNSIAIGFGAASKGEYLTDIIAIGYESLLYGANRNIGIGNYSSASTTDGEGNIGIGYYALHSNTTGNNNVVIGDSAAYDIQTGSENTAVGYKALYGVEGLSYGNTAFGFKAGAKPAWYKSSDGYLTLIGCAANNSAYVSYSTALGFNAFVTSDDQVRIGDPYIFSIGGYQNWTNVSDGRYKNNVKQDVPGLEFINKLNPITYNLDVEGIENFLHGDNEKFRNELNGKEKIVYTGFIAQDVEKAALEIGYDFSGVDKPQNEQTLYGLRYAEFVVPLVKSVQELSAANDSLQSVNAALEERIDRIESLLNISETTYQENENFQKVVLQSNGSVALLAQNIPNPFNGKTIIKYFVPESATSAYIRIVTQSGTELSNTEIAVGHGTLEVDANQLPSGNFMYSLIVDGKIIDTKQMLLTK